MQGAIPYKKVGQSNNGWMSEDLAIFSYKLYQNLSGQQDDWESEPYDVQVRWDRTMTKAIQEIDQAIENQESLSLRGLALSLFDWHWGEATEEQWAALTQRDQLVWEAIGRNCVNCLDSRPGDVKIEEACRRWLEWIERKIAED